MKITSALLILSTVSSAFACSDGHDHSHARRSPAPSTVTPPSRPLVWGEFNILHTTDTHGWLLGHQKASFPEPNYSGDFGDFASFVSRMKYIAVDKGVDLLLVDSGDLHDGTGLTEGYPSGGVDGHDSDEIFSKLPYDLLTIGNHELNNDTVTLDLYKNFIPKFEDSYLSSNAKILLDESSTPVSIGKQMKTFTTLRGQNVTSFGVIYNINAKGKLSVTPVKTMVNEDWFQTAIQNTSVNLFLIPGHMPVTKDNVYNLWHVVHDAIRNVTVNNVKIHATTPIIYLGGHTHIRDCFQLDDYSVSLESGHYMDTVGWLSVNLTESSKALKYTRRYLDTNTVTYEYHTRLQGVEFQTVLGKNVTADLDALSTKFNLSMRYGKTPKDYTTNQVPFENEGNLVRLWIENALPYALGVNNTGKNKYNFIIANNESQRFDIYAGDFTKNDLLSASFYTDIFKYVPNITLSLAQSVLNSMNGNKPSISGRNFDDEWESADIMGDTFDQNLERPQDIHRRWHETGNGADPELTWGYVTNDSCSITGGGNGDDTLHKPLAHFELPHYVSSKPPDVKNDTLIDLVFLDYIWNSTNGVRQTLNRLQSAIVYQYGDAEPYSDLRSFEAIAVYAEKYWNGNSTIN